MRSNYLNAFEDNTGKNFISYFIAVSIVRFVDINDYMIYTSLGNNT